MKKKIARIVLSAALLLLSFCAFIGCSSSGNPYRAQSPDNSYVITDLAVTIDASAGDRSMRVTEEYTFVFYDFAHGFFRDIPLNSGEKVRDLRVRNCAHFYSDYEVSHEDGEILRVRVGSANSYVQTRVPRKCTIEYTLVTPKHADYKNALVLNAVGQGWACAIEQTHINVKLPAETNETPRYFYGGWGESRDPFADALIESAPESGKSEYSIDVGRLEPFQGFTVYYFMPAGTFKTYSEAQTWIIIACALALAAVAVLLKFLLGRSPALAPVTNYYPPKSVKAGEKDLPMDPVEMGYLIDNTCQGSDVTSLIFYFASKGYLEIVQPDEGKKGGNFTLQKVCDLPKGVPSYQQTLFKKIFARGDTVTVSDLTNRTYTAVQSAQTQIKQKFAGKLYDKKARIAAIGMYVLTALFAFFTVFFASRRVSKSYFNPCGALALIPIVLSALLGLYIVYNWLKFGKTKRTVLLVLLALVAVLSSMTLLLPAVATGYNVLGLAESNVTVAAVAFCCMLAPFIARRTEYYTKELDEVLGFKDFLQTAEKDRLEMLLEENPQYYYDILPYANVLGVSDIWQDKFKGLTLEPPSYYRGVTVFDIVLFNSCYRSSYRAFSAATVSRPSS
ncbi:MAG: DUF2207 domain-containing protein, partial [Clostridiales bacterium]|nr:DUF2207 domain-containing protein [Clostridiales bacterium]